MPNTLYIVEISGYHHDCFQSLLHVAAEALNSALPCPFSRIVAITRKLIIQRLSTEFVRRVEGQGVKFEVIASEFDAAPQPGGAVARMLFQERLKKRLWREFLQKAPLKKGDIVIFVTAEMFTAPLVRKLAGYVKSSDAYLITEVHNVFIFFPEVIKPELKPAIEEFYLSGPLYAKLVQRFGKIGRIISLVRKRHLNNSTHEVGKIADGFILPAPQMAIPNDERPVLNLLTRFPTRKTLDRRAKLIGELAHSEPVTFTIPGFVDVRTRDYTPIFEAVSALRDKPLKILLLGSIRTAETLRTLLTLAAPIRKRLEYFESFVDEETYSSRLLNSHYVILPIDFPYGEFKTSGGIGDALSAGVPIMLPENLIDHRKLVHIGYTRESLPQLMPQLLEPDVFVRRSKEMLEFAGQFTVDRMAIRFIDFLNQVIQRGKR